MSCLRFGIGLFALSVLVALRAPKLSAQAQIISLAAAKGSSLAVTLLSGVTQTILGVTDNALNTFAFPVVIRTDWDVKANQTNTVNLVAYFSVPAQALASGVNRIPSSRVRGRVSTGLPTTFTPMTQNGIGGVGSAGGSLRLFSQTITNRNKKDSRVDNLNLQLDLVGFPALLAGAYTGTLNIRAVTQ